MWINGRNIIDLQRAPSGVWSLQEGQRARVLAARQHLFFEGDVRTHLFVVESGWVKLYRTLIDGQRQVVGFCNGGSILGTEGDATHINSCEALTPLKVRSFLISHVTQICNQDPVLAGQLLHQMGRQLGAAQAQLTTVGAQSAQQKLATFLLAFAGYNESDEFEVPVRRIDMGEFLGLRLETISRKMSEFQQRKWIRMLTMYRCRILDREALETLAAGDDSVRSSVAGRPN